MIVWAAEEAPVWTCDRAEQSVLRFIQCRRESLLDWKDEEGSLGNSFKALASTSRGLRSLFREWREPLYAALGRLYIEATLSREATGQLFRFGDVIASVITAHTTVYNGGNHRHTITRQKNLEPPPLPVALPRFDVMRAARGEWAWTE